MDISPTSLEDQLNIVAEMDNSIPCHLYICNLELARLLDQIDTLDELKAVVLSLAMGYERRISLLELK